MARIVKRFQLPQVEKDRDSGKVFILTEMPARKAHSWATRALFGMMNAGVEVPDNIKDAGFAALAAMGINALSKIPVSVGQPLLEELFDCVAYQPGQDPNITRPLIDDDVEEAATLFKLQKSVLELHINFFIPDKLLTSASPETPAT